MNIIRDIKYDNSNKYYEKIVKFLSTEALLNDKQLWEAGRMNCWNSDLHGPKDRNDPFFENSVHLWLDDDEVVALVISEYGDNDLFIEIKIGYEYLSDKILSWVVDVWSVGKSMIKIFCYHDDEEKIELLKRYGLKFHGNSEFKRHYQIDTINYDYTLHSDYQIKAFYEEPNHGSRIELVQSAFDNSTYNRENLDSLQNSADYVKELDLAAISKDGTYAAYCVGWRYPGTTTKGYIEPVGTHVDHRRKGLASSVIKECFIRMKAIGITEVIIGTSPIPGPSTYLYESLSPSRNRKVLDFRLEK